MSRPSLKDQRSREILDAFVTCAARYGLEGATQERVAEEAGVKRTLLRHYLGNKDDMIEALCQHVVGEFDALTGALGAALAERSRSSQLIELLFDPGNQTDPRLVLVFQALTASVPNHPSRRAAVMASLAGFIDVISAFLGRIFPECSRAERNAVAHGMAALFMTADALAPLDPPAAWRTAQRRAATALLKTLERRSS